MLEVTFAGTLTVREDEVIFSHKADGREIKGNEWVLLSEQERSEYVVTDLVDVMLCSDDMEVPTINVYEVSDEKDQEDNE